MSESDSVPQESKQQVPNAIHVQRFLKGIGYPADRQTIIETAREEGADDDALKALEALPDREFDSPAAISRELGKT